MPSLYHREATQSGQAAQHPGQTGAHNLRGSRALDRANLVAAPAKYQTLHTCADGSRLIRHPNGSIYHHSRGKGGTGKQTTGTAVLSEAIEVVRKWTIMAAKIDEDQRGFVTFNEVAEDYREWLRQNGRTRVTDVFLRVLGRFFGDVPVVLISARKVEEYLNWRKAGNGAHAPINWTKTRMRQRGRPADASLYREISVLESMLRWGWKHDRVPEGTKLSFPKGTQGEAREVFLEQDEIEDLLERAARTSDGQHRLTRVHRFVWLALYTGARCAALEELQWSQVDLARRVIHLRKTGTRASKKRRPSVPILDPLLPMLVAARAQAVGPFVLDQGAIRGSWQPFVKTTPYYRDRDLHVHDLRRSFFTMLVTNGMPLADISLTYEISLQVLMKHYAKFATRVGTRVNGFVPVRAAGAVP